MSSDDDVKRARAYDLLATRDGAIDVTFDDDVTALAEALAAERAAGAREMRERAAAVARERRRQWAASSGRDALSDIAKIIAALPLEPEVTP